MSLSFKNKWATLKKKGLVLNKIKLKNLYAVDPIEDSQRFTICM